MDAQTRHWLRLLAKVEGIFAWEYDKTMRLLDATDPDQLWHRVITATRASTVIANASGVGETPLRLEGELALSWIAVRTPSGGCIVLGPVAVMNPPDAQLTAALERTSLTVDDQQQVRDRMPSLQRLSTHAFSQYGRMLHGSLHPDHDGYLKIESIRVGDEEDYAEYELDTPPDSWASENLRLRVIENGTIDYHSMLQRDPFLPGVQGLPVDAPLRQVKISLQVFTGLCARAAIRGGCRPDTSWALNDRYNIAIAEANSAEEVYAVSQRMFDDFVRRVHAVKSTGGHSRIVRVCLELLGAHLYEPYPLSALARDAGYAPYYLSREFHKEMGVTIAAHAQAMKVVEAKALLRTSNRAVKDIADILAFSSASHFIACFRRETGTTPLEYRKTQSAPPAGMTDGDDQAHPDRLLGRRVGGTGPPTVPLSGVQTQGLG